jgi:Icc-related predicted phosphoesterase
MRILAFTDLHEQMEDFMEVKKLAKRADIIVCAGDFTIFENNMKQILHEINNLGKTVILIHGNHESASKTERLCKPLRNIIFIHKSFFKRKNYLFLGYGGGGFTKRDEEFERTTKKFKKLMQPELNTILVVHAPPYKTKLDKIGPKNYVGSKSYREFIEEAQPNIVICGHIEDNSYKNDKIGKTFIINPGPAGTIIEL